MRPAEGFVTVTKYGSDPEFGWVRLVWSEGSGAECVLALGRAGVEALVFAGEVVAPVVAEVAVTDLNRSALLRSGY
jgi:hypothetical protein